MPDSQAIVLAIGVGPFNLGLAALSHQLPDVTVVGLDRSESFEWHPGMMLPEATIQVPFMADLVTLADPTSPFSFLNYLKTRGEIYNFYIRESFFPYRSEYSQYCSWVANQLPDLHWNRDVIDITYDPQQNIFIAHTDGPHGTEEFHGTHLVLGTGTQPAIPSTWPQDSRILHTSHYLSSRDDTLQQDHVTVVGSGQSASEVYLDLLRSHPGRVDWFTRSARHHPMDITQLTLEMTSPDYIDYFDGLTAAQQVTLNANEVHLYKGTSAKTLSEIYALLDHKRINGQPLGEILTNVSIDHIETDQDHLTLELQHKVTQQRARRQSNTVICGTGYQHPELKLLDNLRSMLRTVDGSLVADRNGALDTTGSRIFSQNTRAWKHHLTGPDLGLGAYRNSLILNKLTGRTSYHVEKSFAHQQFGLPESS